MPRRQFRISTGSSPVPSAATAELIAQAKWQTAIRVIKRLEQRAWLIGSHEMVQQNTATVGGTPCLVTKIESHANATNRILLAGAPAVETSATSGRAGPASTGNADPWAECAKQHGRPQMPAKDETRVEKLEGQVRSICSELEKHKTENSKALALLKHEVKTDIENLSHKLHSDFTTSLSAAMTQQSNELRQMLQGITQDTSAPLIIGEIAWKCDHFTCKRIVS